MTDLNLNYILNEQFSCSVIPDSLWPHGLQHARLPYPSLSPRICSNSCPLSWWCHPTISSSVVPFSSCLQSFPASGSFPMSQFFESGGQNIGVSASASVLPMNIQTDFIYNMKFILKLIFYTNGLWYWNFFHLKYQSLSFLWYCLLSD